MEISKKTLNGSNRPGNLPGGDGAHDSVQLLEKARADSDTVLKELGPQLGGLSEAEADSRSKQVGTNEIAREKRPSALMRFLPASPTRRVCAKAAGPSATPSNT